MRAQTWDSVSRDLRLVPAALGPALPAHAALAAALEGLAAAHGANGAAPPGDA